MAYEQSPEIKSYLQINKVGKALEYQTTRGALRPRVVSPLQANQNYGEAVEYVEQRLAELRRAYKEHVPGKDAVQYGVWQSIQSVVKAYTEKEPDTYEKAREALAKIKEDLGKNDALSLQVGKQVGFVIEREEDCVGF